MHWCTWIYLRYPKFCPEMDSQTGTHAWKDGEVRMEVQPLIHHPCNNCVLRVLPAQVWTTCHRFCTWPLKVRVCVRHMSSLYSWLKVDIFSKDLLLIPIHLEVHWSLVSVDIKQRFITYFDSQRTLNRRCPKVWTCHFFLMAFLTTSTI